MKLNKIKILGLLNLGIIVEQNMERERIEIDSMKKKMNKLD